VYAGERARLLGVNLDLARTFVEALVAHDLDAAQSFLDPNVETVTPRGTLHGIAAARQVLAKATGDEQFAIEQTEPEFEELEDEIAVNTREIARWRETGEVAYMRDFALRLTLEEKRIVRIVVMPGAPPP
jgi:SnoaL-like domain